MNEESVLFMSVCILGVDADVDEHEMGGFCIFLFFLRSLSRHVSGVSPVGSVVIDVESNVRHKNRA
jgi:hypothetical protein